MNYEEVQAQAIEYAKLVLEFVSRPEILIQAALVVAMYLPALFISWRIKPALESRLQTIKGFAGPKRVVAAFIRRLQWLVFVALLGIVYLVTSAAAWPASNYIIYAVMLLVLAWVLISVVSKSLKSQALGRLFSIVATVYATAAIFGVSDDMLLMLDRAGFNMGNFRLSILSLIKGAFLLSVLLWAASSSGNFLDRRIQNSQELTPLLRVLIGRILRMSLVGGALLLAMSGIGVNLTALTVLSGAAGVGIGFGLQKVVTNFISCIIILVDESIKPGDTISLGDAFGWIRELRARFVSVVTRDGREFLIPNEDFITTQVVNWSFSDSLVRLDVPFGVSYESDPHEVSRLAIEATAAVERVVTQQKNPVCWITNFGDSSIDFLLRFWIADPQMGLTNIRGQVMLALWDTFKEHDINIPFPHREVIMRTPVEIASPE